MLCPLQNSEHAEVLLDYCARRLRPEVQEDVERHVALCAECREFTTGQKILWETLDAWEAMAVPENFDARLERRIELEQSRGVWTAFKEMVWRPAVPLVAVCAGIILLFLAPSPVIETKAPAAAEVREVEQVERTLDDLDMLWQLGSPVQGDKHT